MKWSEEERKKYEFSLIISLESLINQSVWGWGGVLSVTSDGGGGAELCSLSHQMGLGYFNHRS